jgi:hypothetical protein
MQSVEFEKLTQHSIGKATSLSQTEVGCLLRLDLEQLESQIGFLLTRRSNRSLSGLQADA